MFFNTLTSILIFFPHLTGFKNLLAVGKVVSILVYTLHSKIKQQDAFFIDIHEIAVAVECKQRTGRKYQCKNPVKHTGTFENAGVVGVGLVFSEFHLFSPCAAASPTSIVQP